MRLAPGLFLALFALAPAARADFALGFEVQGDSSLQESAAGRFIYDIHNTKLGVQLGAGRSTNTTFVTHLDLRWATSVNPLRGYALAGLGFVYDKRSCCDGEALFHSTWVNAEIGLGAEWRSLPGFGLFAELGGRGALTTDEFAKSSFFGTLGLALWFDDF